MKEKTSGVKFIDHPAVGRMDLHYDALAIPGVPDCHLIIYTATPGSSSATALTILRMTIEDRAYPRLA